MTSEPIEERNGGYYLAGTRISLDSVVYSFKRGNSPEAIQAEYAFLTLAQIRGAIAFYLEHREAVDRYLKDKQGEFEASAMPMSEANPELWAKLERARKATWTSGVVDMGTPRAAVICSVEHSF